jgi:hypothetical protein
VPIVDMIQAFQDTHHWTTPAALLTIRWPCLAPLLFLVEADEVMIGTGVNI